MNTPIKLDFISDVVCPWCIIGFKRLEKAIMSLGIEDRITLEWQPFELNPQPQAAGEKRGSYLMRKYGMSPEELAKNQQNIAELGNELGFHFDFFDDQKVINTRDAHILIDHAKASGKQTELAMALFSAYFSERGDISKRQILAQALQTAGLNMEEGMTWLDSAQARSDIATKEAYWQDLGVSAVPTLVLNDTEALTGAQPVEVYTRVLSDLL